MTGNTVRSRFGRALTTGMVVAGIVLASVVGLDGWADRAATQDVAATVSAAASDQG
jgi:hypothetical protein